MTVFDGYGCTDVDSVNVFILGPPLADAGTDQAICIFDSTQLNASGGVSYLWSPTTGLSNPNIPNPWASPTTTTTYYVNVTDTIGCSKFDSVTIIVNLPPITDAGIGQIICGTDSVQIGGAPTGPAGSGYSWFPNTNMDDSTLANPTVWPFVDTTYYVIVTDINGCVNIDSVLVSLFPATLADAGTDDTICLNDSVQLGATGGTGYLWSPTTGLSNPNIANPMASPDTTTNYLVIVTDSNGCNAIDTVIVEVNSLPPADAGLDDWICPGDSTQLNATGGVIYVWSPGTGLSNININNPKASPADTTT